MAKPRVSLVAAFTVALLAQDALAAPATAAAAAASGEAFTYRVGGRFHWDADSYDGVLSDAGAGGRRFETELRRARVESSGTFLEDFAWVFDIDVFDRGGTRDAEVFAAGLTYTGWRWADLFVGRQKEPFGLERLSSSNAIASIERNYYVGASDVSRQPHFGVRFDGEAGPLHWSAGLFSPNGNPKKSNGSDRVAFTGRLFGTPIDDGDRVLHLGFGYTDRGLDDPESQRGFGVRVARTAEALQSGSVLADDDHQYGLEMLYLQGAWFLQGEVFQRRLSSAGGGPDGTVRSHYVQLAWTVTGERRDYLASRGIPDAIRPAGPRGALELVAKYDGIVFDVDGLDDQEATGYLLGANWYVNRYARVMLNLIRLDSDGIAAQGLDDKSTVISARLQVAI
jgi:phosphate-selective porin OprO and OprP